MSSRLSLRDYEQFSAYLDGQLSPAETRKLEEQLKANPEWRLALDELAATRAVVRRAPHYRAPRNFTLSPEMAHQVARRPILPSLFSFRFSAALAAVALIAVLVLQVLPGGGPASRVAMAPPAMPTQGPALSLKTEGQTSRAPEAAPQESVQATAQSTPPPVVVWNGQSNMMDTGSPIALGKGGGGGGGTGSSGAEGGIVTFNQSSPGALMAGGDGGAANTFAPPGAIRRNCNLQRRAGSCPVRADLRSRAGTAPRPYGSPPAICPAGRQRPHSGHSLKPGGRADHCHLPWNARQRFSASNRPSPGPRRSLPCPPVDSGHSAGSGIAGRCIYLVCTPPHLNLHEPFFPRPLLSQLWHSAHPASPFWKRTFHLPVVRMDLL
ncbi:hypothetical protein ATHL_03457 [Anaerolinea thermolimosa]|uniref:Zinc-finger domain-containing protein n=1 Tax=Anaerolinea thermolimosa TaxID=229919 RepID=A0A7U9PTA1_9CHLR|nr:hypothetical protein [Anaerolinea thermolimosa]GAP08552.1 hypothetical protein ATHL_03457 [Anaerolinea thermolimosa]